MKMICFFLLPCLIILSCGKDRLKTEIDLTGQSLHTVQKYTSGKWRLMSAQGGFFGNAHIEFEENYFTITPGHFQWMAHDTVIVDNTLTWMPITDILNRKAFFMVTYDVDSMPVFFEPRGYKDGQLYLSQDATDGYGFFLKKIQ